MEDEGDEGIAITNIFDGSLNKKKKDLLVTGEGGKKYSKNKTRTELFMMKSFLRVSDILTHGAKKYSPNNWRKNDIYVHVGALLRHLAEYMLGKRIDSDSGLPITSHIACNANMIDELDADGKKFFIPEEEEE